MESNISSNPSHFSNKRNHKDLNEVELRRSIEEHLEHQRLRAEFGDVIDL